jgi:glycosyltransferase involved in cell wall biosynthesis
MSAADLVVCPSRDDPSPVVVLEAMALGKSIVSTRVGAMPEVLDDGVSALLVGKDDPAGLAAAIRQLLDDPALAQRLGEGARQAFVDHLQIERWGRDIEALLHRILHRR